MCISSSEWSKSSILYISGQKQKPMRSKVQVHRRKKSEEKLAGKDMELRNLKLYMENMSILEENEKLRKKANLLHQENLALMSEFQKKFSQLDRVSATLNLLLPHKQPCQARISGGARALAAGLDEPIAFAYTL